MADVAGSQVIRIVPLEELHESPLNPRKHFDAKSLEELAANIREVGILSPLLVRPGKVRQGAAPDGYEIGAGHRRYRAAKLAQLQEVPCIVREMDDARFLEVLNIENLQREDVHPLDEGEGYRNLMKVGGYDVETVAAKVGKSKSYVYQRLKLAELIEPAKKAFLEEQITAGHAILIARLRPTDQEEALKECFEGNMYGDGILSTRALREYIQDEIHLDLAGAPWDKSKPFEGMNGVRHPACTTCPKRSGYEPALFPELGKQDVCLDRDCFKKKQDAHLQILQYNAKPAGEMLLKLGSWNARGANVLTPREFREANPKSCKFVQRGVVVEGSGVGQIKTICAHSHCKIHHPGGMTRSGSTSAQRESLEADRRKREREELLRYRIVLAIRDKVTVPMGRKDLELVALAMSDRLMDDFSSDVTRQLVGWDPNKEHPAKKIPTLPERELARLIFVLSMADVIHGYFDMSNETPMSRLKRVAERYRVDVIKIEDQLKAEEKAKAAGTAQPVTPQSSKVKPRPKAKPSKLVKKAKKPIKRVQASASKVK